MKKRKLVAIWASLALAIAGLTPAIAAAPINAIAVGQGTTSSIPNIFVEVSTASYSVSITVKIAGTAQAPSGTSTGNYAMGSIKVIKSPGAQVASVHRMTTTYNDFNATLADTGISSDQNAPQSWQGSTTLGSNMSTATLNFSRTAPGGGSGDAVLCLPMRFYHANSSY